WQKKAELAVQRDDDELAREALGRRSLAQKLTDNYNAQWTSQHDQVAELRGALAKLEAKIAEADAKRELIITKQRRAATQEAINTALQSVQGVTADQSLQRMEDKVDQQLARAQAETDLAGQDMDSRFADIERDAQVDNDLADLKKKFGK
ncbi:MAG: PspA/IM30 family protein, partial [Chloroflexia bacterium]